MNKLNLLILLSILTGCSILGSEEPLPLYSLESGFFKKAFEPSFALAIDLPLSEASLDTQRIALTPAPYRREYIANGEWPDYLPKVFQNILIQGFEQKWGASTINRLNSGIQAKYILSSEIEDFSVHSCKEGPAKVHLKVTFKLIDFRERKVMTAKTFTEVKDVSSYTMAGIVDTFNQSAHCLLENTSVWLEAFLKK